MLPESSVTVIQSKVSLLTERSFNSSKLTAKRTTFKTRNLLKKRQDLTIVYQDEVVTPKYLPPIDGGLKSDALSLSQLEIRSQYEMSVFGNVSTSMLYSYVGTSYGSVINKDDFFDDSRSAHSDDSTTPFEELGTYVPPIIMPTTLHLTLTETPVMYLLDIVSKTEVKGTSEAELVEKDNEYYDYLTIGKGRNRKTTNAEIQTEINLLKTRSTIAKRYTRRNEETFASEWEMYDTYGVADLESTTQVHSKSKEEEIKIITPEEQMKSLMLNSKFQESVLIMERVLANNVFNNKQKTFRGLIEQDPFRPDIEFKYKLELLWTFKSSYTTGFPVTSMQWHPQNNDILAVGYGKFYYSDTKKGLVCCWNVKNPKQPEREFYFNVPVTSLAFSDNEPNLIAVGLYDGTVSILDISRKHVDVVVMTKKHLVTNYQPVWQIAWFPPDGYNIYDNHVICVGQDGRVCSFVATKTNDLNEIEMMCVFRSESKLKGVYQPKPCPSNEIPISKTNATLTITKHPLDECIYYIGTSEGGVHKCSKNYQHQHIDVLVCHAGPIYAVEFSHYLPKLYLTCGADSCICIWVEDIKEPLITMTKTMFPVEGAEWCPANATIIANISGNSIFLWDVQRKTYLPASEHVNPENCRCTNIKFAPSGKNLVVGDIEGNVHVYTLKDMPFPPFYQAKMLEQVILKNLVTRTDLVTKIRKENMFKETSHEVKCFVNL